MSSTHLQARWDGCSLVATMVAMLVGPAVPAAAQDDLGVPTRVVVLHADWSLGPVDVHQPRRGALRICVWSGQRLISPSRAACHDHDRPERPQLQLRCLRRGLPGARWQRLLPIVTSPLVLGGVFDTSPIPDDGARVRIVQGAVSLRPVNVTANNKTVEFAEDLGYSSASDSTVVPAGTYDFDVTQAGTAETLLTAPGMVLEANTTYELVIMGQPGDANHPLGAPAAGGHDAAAADPGSLTSQPSSADRTSERRMPDDDGGYGRRVPPGMSNR